VFLILLTIVSSELLPSESLSPVCLILVVLYDLSSRAPAKVLEPISIDLMLEFF
jgi:hypothetical protein